MEGAVPKRKPLNHLRRRRGGDRRRMWNHKQVDEEGDEGENAEGVDEDGGGQGG